MKLNKGFTLIELLVVIAIIGLLSSIVLASLSTARGKANDAKVQGQLASFRSSAEIYYNSNGGYSDGSSPYAGFNGFTSMALPSGSADVFSDATAIASIISTALPAGTKVFYTRNGPMGTKATSYAVAVSLSNGTDAWCVDSAGASKKELNGLSGGFGQSGNLFSGNSCL